MLSTSDLKAGGKAFIVAGLVGRQDLNGQRVTLTSWSEELKRWVVCCDGSYECVQVRPDNLRASSEYARMHPDIQCCSLHQAIRDGLTAMVRGDAAAKLGGYSQAGQITRLAFEGTVEVATKCYSDPSPGSTDGATKEAFVVGLVLDFIGKDGDSALLFQSLKHRLQDAHSPIKLGFCVLPPILANFLDMRTAADISRLMVFMRVGTLAHIESQQALLKNMIPSRLSRLNITSDRNDPSRAFHMIITGVYSKSMTCMSLKKELIDAAMGGEVCIVRY